MRQRLASMALGMAASIMTAWHGTAVAAPPETPDSAAGKDKVQACAACHGPAGISPAGLFPNLAGQHASYLAGQIMAIRDGQRPVPQMTGQLDDYSDQDAWNVAAFYAEQSPALGQADPNEALIEHGRTLYRAGDLDKGIPACSACHSPTGSGIASAAYPVLSGQHPEYTVTALKAFADGSRTSDPNAIMQDIAAKMSEDDMQAVANYVRGLH